MQPAKLRLVSPNNENANAAPERRHLVTFRPLVTYQNWTLLAKLTDDLGDIWIAMTIQPFRMLCVRPEAVDLARYGDNEIDLRTLFGSASDHRLLDITAPRLCLDRAPVTPEWLPEEGFYARSQSQPM